MSLQKFKTFLASTKNTIPCERLQRTVFFMGLSKEQYPKTDMSNLMHINLQTAMEVQDFGTIDQ